VQFADLLHFTLKKKPQRDVSWLKNKVFPIM